MKAGDLELARLAGTRGWISTDILEKVLSETDRFQALGLEKSVEEVLVESGALSAEQVRSLREALGLTLRQPRIGDYEVIRRVGVGGMGTVFEACHVRLRQRIALKILLPRLSKDPRSTERFLREARMLARLNHPHLVHAIDAGQDGERYYLAMEYIEGENLLQMLLRTGPLDPVRSCEIIRDVCEALEVLEGKGLVHRDVKPANILVGADGVVKLADFGLLMGGDEGPGSIQQACGTPHYVSPEQIERKAELDVRSDLYSLGASWYHLVAGKPPFTGKSTREIVEGHLERTPLPPSRFRPELPSTLDNTILRWLSRDRDQRPASARDALAEVTALLSDLQGTNRSPRLGHLPFVALAGLALVGLLLLFVQKPWRSHSDLPLPNSQDPHRVVEMEKREAPPDLPTPAIPAPGPDNPGAKATAAIPASVLKSPRLGTRPTTASSTVTAPPLPPPLTPQKPFLLPLLARARDAAKGKLNRAAVLAGEARTRWGLAADEIAALERFRGSFHARSVAIEPRAVPGEVILGYELEEATELLDFRAKQGSWGIRNGQLFGLGEPISEPLWSVAWFELPVVVEGELPRAAAMIIGFEDLCVAVGVGGDARVWREDESAPVPVLAAPIVPAGHWRATFTRDGIELLVGRGAFSVALPVEPSKSLQPGVGRISLKLAPLKSLERLRIDGRLSAEWVRERLRILGTTR